MCTWLKSKSLERIYIKQNSWRIMFLVVCVMNDMFSWISKEYRRGCVWKVLVTEEKISLFLYKKLSLDLLSSCVSENIRKSVMLLWEQRGIGNWIFFRRPLLCSDHSNKFHDDSSHIMSQPRKTITATWFSDPNSDITVKKHYFLKWKYLVWNSSFFWILCYIS